MQTSLKRGERVFAVGSGNKGTIVSIEVDAYGPRYLVDTGGWAPPERRGEWYRRAQLQRLKPEHDLGPNQGKS